MSYVPHTDAERRERRDQAKSLLDSLGEQVGSLNRSLPAADRSRLSDYLDQVLNADAEQRMAEANSLSILNVRSGKVREFRTSLREP